MSIFTLVIILGCLAVAVILARRLPDSAQPIKSFIIWFLIVIAVWVFLSAVGIIDVLRGIIVPKIS